MPLIAGAVGPEGARRLLRRGRARLGVEARDAWDRLVASDPGLNRLRRGLRAVVAVGTTIGIQLLVAALLDVSGPARILHLTLGSLLAMNMATVIRQAPRRQTAVSAAWAPVAAALGATTAAVAAPAHLVAVAVFVVICAAAVWVRRFGGHWFAAGFIVWQAYFFTLYLHPPLSALPGMLIAIAASGAWVGLLLLTVLHAEPERTFRRTVTALRARARAVVSHALDVLQEPSEDRVRRLRAQLVKLSEVTLLFDAQLADRRALPEGYSAARLRRWIVEVEISCEELAHATVALATTGVAEETVAQARQTLRQLGWGHLDAAFAAVRELRSPPHNRYSPARRLGNAAQTLVASVSDWDTGRLAEEAPDDEYEPVVGLVGGNLPGTSVGPGREGHGWLTAPRTWSTTSRQSIQAGAAAALAIAAGELISHQRFYWAVIAAFVAFSGTATVGETVRKSLSRTAGTVAGLVVAVGFAEATLGHPGVTLAVLLGCIFLAFYLQAISYAAMIFFITVMLGELYGLLNRFSDSVLLVRLAETAAGAAAGILVSLLVLPTGTRAVLIRARRGLLEELAELTAACADRLERRTGGQRLLTDAVRLDEAARQVVRNADSLVSVRGLDRDHTGRRHRVAVLAVCVSTARSLVPAVLAAPATTPAQLVGACRALSDEARRLAAVPDLRDLEARAEGEPDISAEVAALLDEADETPVVLVRRIQRLADSLALLVPRAR